MRKVLAIRKGWALAGLALVGLVVAGAVVSVVDGQAGDASGNEMATVSRDASGVSDAFAGKGQAAPVSPPDGGGGSTAVVPGAPRVVRTAELQVEVRKGGFTAAFDRVASLAAANGGFVSSSTTGTIDDARSGQLTVRVPADRFDTVRLALSELGDVESQSIRGEDVSGQLVDYGARLTSLQAQETALLALVGQAKAVGDVLQVQSTLFGVRQQIEQLKAQKANLEQSVALATIQVGLFEPGAALVTRPVDDRPSLARSFERAVDGSLAVVGGMIVVVGYLVPLGVLGLVVWGGSRVVRRRPAGVQVPSGSAI